MRVEVQLQELSRDSNSLLCNITAVREFNRDPLNFIDPSPTGTLPKFGAHKVFIIQADSKGSDHIQPHPAIHPHTIFLCCIQCSMCSGPPTDNPQLIHPGGDTRHTTRIVEGKQQTQDKDNVVVSNRYTDAYKVGINSEGTGKPEGLLAWRSGRGSSQWDVHL